MSVASGAVRRKLHLPSDQSDDGLYPPLRTQDASHLKSNETETDVPVVDTRRSPATRPQPTDVNKALDAEKGDSKTRSQPKSKQNHARRRSPRTTQGKITDTGLVGDVIRPEPDQRTGVDHHSRVNPKLSSANPRRTSTHQDCEVEQVTAQADAVEQVTAQDDEVEEVSAQADDVTLTRTDEKPAPRSRDDPLRRQSDGIRELDTVTAARRKRRDALPSNPSTASRDVFQSAKPVQKSDKRGEKRRGDAVPVTAPEISVSLSPPSGSITVSTTRWALGNSRRMT